MRILVILCFDDYVRYYVHTGAFRDLEREHDVRFILSDRCKMRDVPGLVGTIPTQDREILRAHAMLFDVLSWRYRHRSRTFKYRLSRLYKTFPNNSINNVLSNLIGLREAAKYALLGNRVIGPWFIRRQRASIPMNPDLERIVREQQPDLVILPSTATEPIGSDLVRIAQVARAFSTLFLIDNWDNLSSKSLFWAPPDYLGVWGEQAREHAASIHDIEASRVSLVGTPRFEAYYSARKGAMRRHYAFRYILFCGAALAFDELTALRRLDDELAAHPEVYGDIKIVYRPHPRRQRRLCPDVFHEHDFRRVVLDEQVRTAYYDNDPDSQPALDYYPALLAEAELVVCPLTTMLVEALLCGTRVLAITYDDGIHYTSPHNAYRYYRHFEGIETIKELYLNRSAEQLGADIRALITRSSPTNRDEIFDSLQHFLYRDSRSYSERLAAAVGQIAARRQTAT